MRFKLLRYFSIASAVAVVAVTAILAVVYGRYATDSLVTSVERQNVILASFIANDLSARVPQHFKADIPDAENLATARHVQHVKDIDAILKDLLKSLPVLKVKAYRDDLTIYSTEHRQIGEIKSTPGFLKAFNQGIPASKLSFRGEFNAFEGVVSNRNLVETYVPVGAPETMTGESGRLIIEIYTDVTPLVAEIEQSKVNLVAGLIFLFAALYGVLVLIVRRADRVIDRQYEDLNGEITERKKAEEAMQESEEKHRHFSADVAHELRTPLAALRSHLDNLENTETIQSLIQDVDVMSRLVSQLLATTRLDSLTVNPNDVADLHAIGTEVAKYLAPFAIKEGRSIEMTGTQGPVIVRGNDDALEMAVRNLVENAIRYSARETMVTIHVSDEPAISVIDRGRGIPSEQQKVIFQRFKRADRRSGGAGLGLSIVQRVIEAHQATIDITDAPGGGTVFKINFSSLKSLKLVEV